MKTGEDIARRFTEVSREILESSRNELYFYMRYLGLALSGLDFVITTDLPGIGTDGASLVVNPKNLADLYQKDRRLVTRIYLHEVYHCLFRHIFRKMPRQQVYWMLACDMAVEFLIDSGDGRAVRMPRSRYRMNVRSFYEKQVKVLNAESIYRALCRVNPDENEIARLRREFCVDDHSLWPSRQPDRNPELPPSAAKLKDKWDDISRKTQTEMESFSKDTSRGAQDLLEQTKVENRERYDYQSFLRKFAVLREEMHVDDDSFDYVLYTYGLNFYGNMPLIEPQEMREVKKIEEFVIVVDVSMSVSGSLVHTFLEQTYNVLSESESFLKKVNIRILQCDEEVRSDVRIHSKKELEQYMERFQLTGGGGTDFRPAFAYVDRLIREKEFVNLKGLLYFTDGYGIYPRKKPSYDTAFIFCEEDYEDRNVPPWAIRLILPRQDLEPDNEMREDFRFVWDDGDG